MSAPDELTETLLNATRRIDVLDKGYVRVVKHMGDDLDVVNSAKVSFAKESKTFGEKETILLEKLAEEEHGSPFRHSVITLEVKAPLFVARQWWKYVVGSMHDPMQAWNEASRRYMTRTPEFYIPDVWRSAPDERRQGSGEPIDPIYLSLTGLPFDYHKHIEMSVNLYKAAIDEGICAEQARLFLPAYAMYTVWRWTCSLQGCLHFLNQRLDDLAQWEIQQYAIAVRDLVSPLFPKTFEYFDLN